MSQTVATHNGKRSTVTTTVYEPFAGDRWSQGRTKRSDVLRFRLSEAEARAFRAFCEAHGLSVTEALRRMARGAGGLGPTFSGEGHGHIVDLTRQIRTLGVNLNQAVHQIHEGRVFAAEEMRSWLEETLAVIRALDSLYSSLATRARMRAEAAIGTPLP